MYNEYDKLFTDLYSLYMAEKNNLNQLERYTGKERYFHASGAGLCMRKKYFESTNVPVTNHPDNEGLKRMRLGTVVHSEFEQAIEDYFLGKKESEIKKEIKSIEPSKSYYKALYSTIKELYPTLKEIRSEKEIVLEDLNVRGFYDFLVIGESGDGSRFGEQIHLYDLKTIGTYPYKLKFGRRPERNPGIHHEMQLGTYGLAVEREFGRIDSMRLFYYRKDDSFHKFKEVPYSYIRMAETYWLEVNDKISRGVPPLEEGVSPVNLKWECNYCNYRNHCNQLKDKGI